MIKKFSFDDRLGHTDMVLSGKKTCVILPAPSMPIGSIYHIIERKIIFTDVNGRVLDKYKLLLSPGDTYKIMRPYKYMPPSGVGFGKFSSYGWRDKRAVPLSDLKDAFKVESMRYVKIEEVSEAEWLSCGLKEGQSYEDMMMRMFGSVPEYVFVNMIKLL